MSLARALMPPAARRPPPAVEAARATPFLTLALNSPAPAATTRTLDPHDGLEETGLSCFPPRAPYKTPGARTSSLFSSRQSRSARSQATTMDDAEAMVKKEMEVRTRILGM